MIKVLFIDRNNPHIIKWIRGFSKCVKPGEIKVCCISDREASFEDDSLKIFNIKDIPQHLSIEELQNKYNFSIYKKLAAERSFFDYTSFRKSQRYSDFPLDKIEKKILPYLNAYDYVIREKIDLIIDSLADNFLTSIAGEIAKHYNKKIIFKLLYYWWSDGFLPLDRVDQTSSIIDQKYHYYYLNPEKIDNELIAQTFKTQKISWQFEKQNYFKEFISRIKIVCNRNNSYESLSVKNWIFRRLDWALSRFLYNICVKKYHRPVDGERYVLYPLHVAPEAVLLGSSPELADQFWLIKNISMNLPWGVRLYVKDHPSQQIGLGLNYDFYRKLSTLSNVRYFSSSVRAESLYEQKNCLAVTVINGTVGLEAAMHEKFVYVFGDAAYGEAACFIRPKNFNDFSIHLLSVMRGEPKFDRKALDAVLMALISSVVRGVVDFGQFKTWEERSFASYSLHNDFIKSFCKPS